MLGKRATPAELKARWAYSEISATRWQAKYERFESNRVRQGLQFDQLTQDEKQHLVGMCESYRNGMATEVDRHPAYECQLWTKEQFGRTLTIPRMAPNRNANIPFLSFIACPRFDEDSDPRVQADRIPFDTPFLQTEPVIVLNYGTPDDPFPMLLEGYLRGVLFMRSANANERIMVWWPVV